MSISLPRLVTITTPATDAAKLRDFYNGVFDLRLSRSIKDSNKAYQTWASAGVKWTINERYTPNEPSMPHFAVPDLMAFANKIKAAGGKVFGDPVDLTFLEDFHADYQQKFEQFKFGKAGEVSKSLGRFLACSDPEGNRFGILQLDPWAEKLFAGGEVSKIERAEQEASTEHAKRLESAGR